VKLFVSIGFFNTFATHFAKYNCMTSTEENRSEFNTTNFLMFLYKWKLPLIIIVVAAALLSTGFTFLITPKYKSTVILFPTSTNAVSKALLADNFGPQQDILEFGEEEQTEQLLQILNSNEIRSRVIKKFNLGDHYEIDPGSKYRMTELIDEYNANITFRRTEFMAVEISVLDKDPQMAADIANTISDLLDTVKNNMQKERALKAYRIVQSEYLVMQRQIQELEDSLDGIRQLGINDYETQAEAYNAELAKALSKKDPVAVKALEERLKILAEYGGEYVSLRDQLQHLQVQGKDLKAKFEEAKVDAQENLPVKFIVDKAYKAEKKAYPVRWIIVVVSTISALFLAVLLLIVLDNIGKKKRKRMMA
jgi:uncharacterized protein involved in exopolysaccharide biosynthesis